MKYFLLLMLFAPCVTAFSQADTTIYGYVNGTLLETEIRPAYPGGPMAWKRYLDKNLHQQNVSGTVTVEFIIDTDGKTSNYKITKSSNPDLDEEALHLILKSGNWVPAIQLGKKVKYRNRVEITFP